MDAFEQMLDELETTRDINRRLDILQFFYFMSQSSIHAQFMALDNEIPASETFHAVRDNLSTLAQMITEKLSQL